MKRFAIVASALVSIVAGRVEASPQRCQKVLLDAGRKYVAMIYATEHRDCMYIDGAACQIKKRRDHYVSLKGGKVPRRCSNTDVATLMAQDRIGCNMAADEINQAGLGQCFLDFFEQRAERWVDLIYTSGQPDACKSTLFYATQRFLRAVGRGEMRCRARMLRSGEQGSCSRDDKFERTLARQIRRFGASDCDNDVLVATVLDIAIDITHATVEFADDRFVY